MIKKTGATIVLWILKFSAKIQLHKTKPFIIGIAGSAGKSSVTHLISLILQAKYEVKQSKGKNSETGIPLDLLGIEMTGYGALDWLLALFKIPFYLIFNFPRYKYYIVEMGIDSPYPPKNMSTLLNILVPDIGILTNISIEHSLNFDNLSNEKTDLKRKEEILNLIANEEILIVEKAKKISIINLDDSKTRSLISRIQGSSIGVSMQDQSAEYFGVIEEISLQKFTLKIIHDNKTYHITIPQPLPKHYAHSLLLSITCAKSAGIDIEESITILENKFSLPPGRAKIFKGIKDSVVIDSSYNNATLEPLLDFLDMVQNVAGNRRKVAILGDMREQGSLSRIQHEELAEKIIKTLDFAILIGQNLTEFTVPILDKNGFNFKAFPIFSKARETILESIEKEDLILVKSSQNTLYLERVVEMLLADKADAILLCRRGDYWDKIRGETS